MMKKLSVIFLALTMILSASPALGGQKSSSRTGAIRGRLITDDGQPILKATVRINAVRMTSGVGRVVGVEEDGRFEAADLASGLYRIFVIAPGYANPVNPAERKFYRPGDFVTIKLARGGVITGAVSAFTGEPVVAVPVRAIRVRDEEGRPLRFPSSSQSRQTDDRGVYRLYGLLPGYYLIAAGSGPSFTSMQFSDYTEHSPTYYPSATRDTAAEVAVRGGQEITGADIRYRAERGYSISGTVTGNIPPSTMGGASVTLRQISGGVNQSVQVMQGEARAFAIHGVADGEYEITARSFAQTGEGDVSPARRVTVKGADVTGLELALAPLGSISGRIVLESSPTACKKDRTPLPQEIALTALEDRGKDEGVRQASETAPDEKGEFTLRGLEAASYRLDFNLPDVWYVREITSPAGAKKTADTAAVAIKSGEKATGLIIAIAEGAASLSGRLVGEKENEPLPSRTRLHLVPAEKELSDNPLRYAEAIVKSDGLFAFTNIAPGRYRLLARAMADDEIFSDARPAVWDAAGRRKLRAEAETITAVIELKPCQKMIDHLLKFSPTVRKID
ncbi:MAG: carboxypeptidase-like regulatory domain-containing protein [Acidobacteriota bacterium]